MRDDRVESENYVERVELFLRRWVEKSAFGVGVLIRSREVARFYAPDSKLSTDLIRSRI